MGNDSGLPEVETLISLIEIFGCTIDDLLNYDSTSKQEYEKHYNLMAKAYTFGTVFILLGICVSLFTGIYFPENTKYEFVCQILLSFFVLIGVICFVYFGMIDAHFKKQKNELRAITTFRVINIHCLLVALCQEYSLVTTIGVGIIIVQILVENIYNENLATALFMILITVAVGIFVYFGTLKNKYDLADF